MSTRPQSKREVQKLNRRSVVEASEPMPVVEEAPVVKAKKRKTKKKARKSGKKS